MHYHPWSFTHIPKDFHQETYRRIAEIINRGESLQLFGAPGSGTSVLLEALTQITEIQNRYFPQDKNYKFILINGNTLLERSSLTLARLFLSSLSKQIDISNDALVINRQTEELINNICSKGNLIIILDQLQELDFPELKPFYATIKVKQPNPQFIFGTTRRYTQNSDLENFAQLSRMLVQNTIVMPPLNKSLSNWLIKEEEEQLGIKLTAREREKVFYLTQGFPRAIKRLMESIARGFILTQLEKDPTKDSVLNLFLSDLILYRNDLLKEIPLLETFVKNNSIQSSIEKVGNILLNQRLTKNEEKILKVLQKCRGELLEREKAIEYIWGNKAINISDHAYDQIIHRLRNKIKSSQPKIGIETVRGRGHVLITKNSPDL